MRLAHQPIRTASGWRSHTNRRLVLRSNMRGDNQLDSRRRAILNCKKMKAPAGARILRLLLQKGRDIRHLLRRQPQLRRTQHK